VVADSPVVVARYVNNSLLANIPFTDPSNLRFAEVLPFSRYELENGKWTPRRFPPSCGARRDIPADAIIHPSVYALRRSNILHEDELPRLGGDHRYGHVASLVREPWWNLWGLFGRRKPTTSEPHLHEEVAVLLDRESALAGEHYFGEPAVNGTAPEPAR
jgi:hypothetical protein